MIEQLMGNWLCWFILLLALACYQLIFLDYFSSRIQTSKAGKAYDVRQEIDKNQQREFSAILITALPLIGLLGTIVGLLDCFAGIASGGASSELISSGIADALLTTQLGLVCAIPAWLLQSWVTATSRRPSLPSFEVAN